MTTKTAIVTGASGNLGQAVVKKFLAEGFSVVGTMIPGEPLPSAIAGERLETKTVDLLSEADAGIFVQDVIEKYGAVHTSVLTVGGFAMGNIAATTTADITKQYRLNFETAYNIARPVFLHMLKQNSGRIFLVGSKPGIAAANAKGMVAYGLGKSLLFRLAELLNDEAKGTGVVVSVIVPGTIDTLQNRNAMPSADFSKWVTPDTIAAVIHYYSSSMAAAISEPVIKLYNNY